MKIIKKLMEKIQEAKLQHVLAVEEQLLMHELKADSECNDAEFFRLAQARRKNLHVTMLAYFPTYDKSGNFKGMKLINELGSSDVPLRCEELDTSQIAFRREAATAFSRRKSVKVGESFDLEGLAVTGFGNFKRIFPVKKVSESAVIYRGAIISLDTNELLQYSKSNLDPVYYGYNWRGEK